MSDWERTERAGVWRYTGKGITMSHDQKRASGDGQVEASGMLSRDRECSNNGGGHEADWHGLSYGVVSSTGVLVDVPCRWCGQRGSFLLRVRDVGVQW